MLTPSDIQNQVFTKAMFGGYTMAQVDDFLEKVYADYDSLYKENAVLKGKLKVLVEKVEEYRSTEDSMGSALLIAQKTADEMLQKAREESDALIKSAEAKSDNIIFDTEAEVADQIREIRSAIIVEEQKLEKAQSATSEYVDKISELCKAQLQLFSRLGELVSAAAPEEPSSPASTVEDTAKSIKDSVEKISESMPSAVDEPTVSADSFSIDNAPTIKSKFDFSDLQFGNNYTKE